MLKSRLSLILYLIFLLVISFSLLNFIIYLKIKNIVNELVYVKAFTFFLTNGKEYSDIFVFWNEKMQGYKVYTFSSSNFPFLVYVGVPEDYVDSILNKLFLSIISLEFLITFLFATLYLGVIESFTKKLEQQRNMLKDLGLSIMHKAGNFISIQRINLKLLQQNLTSSPILHRMEKSLSGFQRDINLMSNILEEKEIKKEWLNLKTFIEDTIEDLIEDYSDKRLIKSLKDAYVHADALDMESIIYNLVANAFKHSASFIHIKICVKNKRVLLVIRNDMGKGAGTGVGLRLLKRAVERQNGKISIRIKDKFTAHLLFPSL